MGNGVFSFSEPKLSPSATAGAALEELYFRKGKNCCNSSSQKEQESVTDKHVDTKVSRGDEGSRKVRSRAEPGKKGEVWERHC